MEFYQKLQALRKQKNMTQEELAQKLYVSRTAVSKWESGRGYPNIDSLKTIAKEFDVSIDELLSNDELIELANTENKRKVRGLQNIVYAILDVLMLCFIFLPFYGKQVGDYVQSVNLLSYSGENAFITVMFFALLIAMAIVGVAEFICLKPFEKATHILNTISIILHLSTILFFALSRQPYVTALLLVFLIVKGTVNVVKAKI